LVENGLSERPLFKDGRHGTKGEGHMQVKLRKWSPLIGHYLTIPFTWLRRRWHAHLLAALHEAERSGQIDLPGSFIDCWRERMRQETDRLASQVNQQIDTLVGRMDHQLAIMLDRTRERLDQELDTLQPSLPPGEALAPTQGDSPLANFRPTLESQGLFVIGSARSGTTILASCLNRSKEIHLLEEPDFFLNHERKDFLGFFNQRHRSYGNYLRKGTFIPPSPSGADGAFDFLNRMRQRYRYVGEKMAISPHPYVYGEDWQTRCLDFYAKYFYGATYFFIIRAPNEVLWSMKKKFPELSTEELLEGWLQAVDFQIQMYLAFENTFIIFFDRLSAESLQDLSQLIGVKMDIPAGLINDRHKQSFLGPEEMPAFLEGYAELYRECQEIYDSMRERFCPVRFRYVFHANIDRFFFNTRNRIAEVIAEIHNPRQRGCIAA
jgi:hypothetical protein